MKVTRRTLLGSMISAAAVAQTPPSAPVDYFAVSSDAIKRSADAIAKVALPQSTEPAFVFKA